MSACSRSVSISLARASPAISRRILRAAMSAFDGLRGAVRTADYLGIQWVRAPRAAIAAARGFSGIAKGRALESLFDRRLWHMTAGETEFPLRTLVFNLSRRRLETFGSEQTPDLRLGELARIAMARAGEAVRHAGELYVDGSSIVAQPGNAPMLDTLLTRIHLT